MLNMAVDMLNIIVPNRPTNPSIIKGLKQPTQLNKENATILSRTMQSTAKRISRPDKNKEKNPLDRTDECDHKKDLKCNLEKLQENLFPSKPAAAQISPYSLTPNNSQVDFTV